VLIVLGVVQLTAGFSLMAGNAFGPRDDRHHRHPIGMNVVPFR
jgi:hypothetical protein